MTASLLLLTALSLGAEPGSAANSVDYLRNVKPLLRDKCYSCHGPTQQKRGLRVDTVEFLRAGGKSGPAVIPGKSGDSLLLQAITGEGARRMPPQGEGEPFTAAQIPLLKAWIDQGAVAPKDETPEDPRRHWAYQRPVRPPVPQVGNTSRLRNPVDAFIAAEHEKRGLQPRPAASKEVLLRRVYIDLIGLPPTQTELHAFLADPAADAYEQVVERLLANPRYGERWGRHWMDVWRYSDCYGRTAAMNQYRHSQRHVWRWRDWIIDSLNQNKGYDRMVLEMLAADELAPLDDEAARATGYLGRNYFVFNRNIWLQDTVEYTAAAFLGITLKCCRCHDHKYDPFTQKDYYRFRAFFEPHQVRTDRLPGKPEMIDIYQRGLQPKEGFDRVFDAQPQPPTYLFVRGNELNPLKEEPLAAGVPAFLQQGDLNIKPIALPLEAYYPNMRSFFIEEATTTLTAAAAKAEAALARANDALAAAEEMLADDATIQKLTATARLAEKSALRARAEPVWLQARCAAERFKYTNPTDPRLLESVRAAAGAERAFELCKAEEEAAQLELRLVDAQVACEQKPADAKLKEVLNAVRAQLAKAHEKAKTAQAALGKSDAHYQPLGPVYPAASTGRRLALARWIVAPDNPLTARVAINHIWLRHFGSALVPTVANFGLNGKPPNHPALLDWLAVELMENGWNMKAIHRLLVTSNAYRMESADSLEDTPRRIDPENRYLWRMYDRRMEAEVVRDSMLYLAGQLAGTMGGPDLDAALAETSNRRSIYLKHTPDDTATMLDLFDSASPAECFRRTESIIPQQPLALLNSSFSYRCARLLAQSLSRQSAKADDAAFIVSAFEQVLSRPPTPEEREACGKFLARQEALFRELPAPAKRAADPRQRARESLIHVLFNYNEFVTIR